MAWHPFEPGINYKKDDIVEKCNAYIKEGKVQNPQEKKRYVEEINSYLGDELIFKPTTGWGASPMNPNSWETPDGKSIRSSKKLSSKRKNISINNINFPDELPLQETYTEGTKKTVTVNAFERNPEARQKCLKHFGYQCAACEVLLKDRYGEIADNFIHVHHIKPLSDVNEKYEVDPINDLIPVCPNCHAMLHKNNPPFSIDELKSIIRNHQ